MSRLCSRQQFPSAPLGLGVGGHGLLVVGLALRHSFRVRASAAWRERAETSQRLWHEVGRLRRRQRRDHSLAPHQFVW
jgi:hypothetical protein